MDRYVTFGSGPIAQRPPRVALFATKGTGSNEEERIKALLAPLNPISIPFDRGAKRMGFRTILATVRRTRPDLLVMEGTGLAGGLACLLAHLRFGTRYVVSSGDAVGPFVAAHVRGLGLPFTIYERLLCRRAAGFIGWTPYLTGRALTFGVPAAVTAPGWASVVKSSAELAAARDRIRRQLNIPPAALVIGLVGSLIWNRRVAYCYGYELVRAIHMVRRTDAFIIVVGGGSGLERLRDLAGPLLGSRIFLPGPVDSSTAMDHMAAMDVGSLPQSTDAVGSFRYTTKVSEYLAAALPIVTGRIPIAYDLAADWCWRLPGLAPWDERYIGALACLIDALTPAAIAEKKTALATASSTFDPADQARRVTAFVRDLLHP